MVGLLQLPLELLRFISSLVWPGDLVNFAVSQKILNHASRSALTEHRKLYETWSGSSNGTRHDYKSLLDMLKATIDQPALGRYVRKLKLKEREDEVWPVELHRSDISFLTREHPISPFLQLFEATVYLDDDLVDPDEISQDAESLVQCFPTASETLISMLLILRLPNLTDLSYSTDSFKYPSNIFYDLFGSLVEQVNTQDLHVLSNLEMRSPRTNGRYNPTDIAYVAKAMHFPGIKTIKVDAIIDMQNSGDGEDFGEHSSLEELIVKYQSQDFSLWLPRLLGSTSGLRRFKMSYQPRQRLTSPPIHVLLLQHCRDTLEELTLSIQDFAGKKYNVACDLSAFTKLRTIEVDFYALFSHQDLQAYWPIICFSKKQFERTSHLALPLAKRLPKSIEHLKIFAALAGYQMLIVAEVIGLLEDDTTISCLPALKQITLEVEESLEIKNVDGDEEAMEQLRLNEVLRAIVKEKSQRVCVDIMYLDRSSMWKADDEDE